MKSFYMIIFLLFALCIGLRYSLLLIYQNKLPIIYSNGTKSICHYGLNDKNAMSINHEFWNDYAISEIKQPNGRYFMFKTKDMLNYKDYILLGETSDLEIWHFKNQKSRKLFIIQQKIMKIATNIMKCHKEPNFLHKTHLYCMIKRFIYKFYRKKNIKITDDELTENGLLFFLADKYQVDVKIRLILDMNYDDNIENHNLSIVRSQRNDDYYYDRLLKAQFGSKSDQYISKPQKIIRKFRRDPDIKRIIKNFKPEKFLCDIRFLIQDHDEDISKSEFFDLLNVQYEEEYGSKKQEKTYIYDYENYKNLLNSTINVKKETEIENLKDQKNLSSDLFNKTFESVKNEANEQKESVIIKNVDLQDNLNKNLSENFDVGLLKNDTILFNQNTTTILPRKNNCKYKIERIINSSYYSDLPEPLNLLAEESINFNEEKNLTKKLEIKDIANNQNLLKSTKEISYDKSPDLSKKEND